MATRQDTLWEQLLKPLFSQFLIDGDALKQISDSIDWEDEKTRFTNPELVYPDYYRSSAFHGIEGGYLTSSAAVTYDPITQYVLPPNENWVRQALIDAVQVYPERILDLGCGTGSTTLMLKQAFPEAEVIGLDLSPYMLIMAERKGKQEGLKIQWLQGNAEKTDFPAAYFDLVSASLLFHETPVSVSQRILEESFRLLTTGGQMIILDGNQGSLRQTPWLTNIFEEPYIQDYAQESVDAWLGKAGFARVRTETFWWVHQVTQGIKPMVNESLSVVDEDLSLKQIIV